MPEPPLWRAGSATTRQSRRWPLHGVGLRAQPEANTLVYGSPQDISNLDPHTGHDYSIAWGQRAVYDSLLRYEGNPGELKPLLATEVVGSPDATTWTIKLADNATFHDGSAVTAEAVQYNFQRMLRKNLGVAWMFATVMDQDSIEVVDPTTLKINLLKPFAPYDAVLPWLFVANPKIVQEHDVNGDEGEAWLKENEAGGGPYTIGRWDIGNSYEFKRFPDYWFDPENGIKPIDTFVWRIIHRVIHQAHRHGDRRGSIWRLVYARGSRCSGFARQVRCQADAVDGRPSPSS